MKKDILSTKDIEKLMRLFLEKVKSDTTINFFFSDVMTVDWDAHTRQMCCFWENVLFYTGDYQGNPIETHKQMNEKHKTEPIHFQKWKELFFETIDSLYKGENVEKMKQHTNKIAEVMMQKM